MTAPAPLTPAECIEALCEAQHDVALWTQMERWDGEDPRNRRDAIKAALVAFVDAVLAELMIPCGIPCEREGGCGSPSCEAWRKLEEACRGR